MQPLTAQEMELVFGGDNPAMGPYAPPFTPQAQADYMNAMKPIVGLMGLGSGFFEAAMQRDLQARAAAYNTLNGYNSAGENYSFPSGACPYFLASM